MSITELFGIKYPILQGAMAQISTSQLVIAVSEAGGLGIIASAGMDAEQLRSEIKEVQKHTDKPFAVNLMLMMSNVDELVDVLIEQKVKIVTTGAGTPKRFMDKFKQANVKVVPVVPSVKLAVKMDELGVDAVIAEGTEAGGHIGKTTTMSLIPQVVDAVNIPVIAAGGIADARGLLAAQALGASGIQAGTLFLTALECPVPNSYKLKVLEANDTSTVVTGQRIGRMVRVINNPMSQQYLEMEYNNENQDKLDSLTNGSLERAVHNGDVETGSVMAGQISGLLTVIRPVKEIIETIINDYQTLKSNL
ncbi:DUF561 domain-containing protein [Erysipelothrix urinaevulpis]|uniref:DUF561 domain-containing protein n=1 Tax=Erysipelothrix urinaevulpis TaxID=2683717 RepID=UPI00135929E0|nr:DUF561 domain-containing protein [Erysipelothrix urinaevulpis]